MPLMELDPEVRRSKLEEFEPGHVGGIPLVGV